MASSSEPTRKNSRSFRLVKAILPVRMAPLAHAELAILWMAIFTWVKPKLAPTERAFTSYGAFDPVLVAIIGLSIISADFVRVASS